MEHYVHRAKAVCEATPGSVLPDQFENLANADAHFKTTGPEIWEQSGGHIDAFACAAGTGGTIAGVSRYLKSKDSNIKVFLIGEFLF